jgi:hypothetical protein
MAASGVKGNDDDDVARWFVTFPKFLARRGPAVIIVDHVPKDPNAPSRFMIGSQRKTAAIDGASYRIEAVKVPSRDTDGLLKVIVAKDRHGTRAMGGTAAMVTVAHQLDGSLSLTLTAAPQTPHNPDGTFRPTVYMERVSRYLEEHPGLSQRAIESQVEGTAKHVRKAVTVLRQEGWIEQDPAARSFSYIVRKPYREADDPVTHGESETTDSVNGPVDNLTASPASPRVPPASPTRLQSASPASPPLRGDAVASRGETHPEPAKRVPPASPVDNSRPQIDPIVDLFRVEIPPASPTGEPAP